MTRVTHAVERRFVVPGRAVSFRSPSADAYKRQVRAIARRIFPGRPTSRPIDVFVDYFHATRRRVDMDNVAKCILDSLNGIAYVDDRQVRRQTAQSYDLRSSVILGAGPVDLVKPLLRHSEYLFVRVRDVPGVRRKGRRRRSA